MAEYHFEEIKEEHLPIVLGIYNYYVVNSSATFHLEPLTLEEMRKLVFFDDPKYNTYVITAEGVVHGYCLLSRFKKREAYDCTAEITLYLHPDSVGKGIGSISIDFIEQKARKNGFHVLLAVICGENTKSISLFKKKGYTKCAHFKEVGRKFQRYLDVVCYQKIL